MSDPNIDVENLENQQDQEDEKRRPVLGIPLILIVLLLVLVCGGFAVVNGLGRVQPTEEPTEEAVGQPVVETTEEVVVTEEATQEATEEATEEATQEATQKATEEATAEPTEEVTAEPTEEIIVVIITEEPPPTCGDGVCTEGVENTDLCHEDCPCVDDGTCASTETDQCSDCGTTAGACSNVCTSDSQCAAGLSCVGGTCQSAAICQGITPDKPKKDVTCTCKEFGPYASCSDGSNRTDFSCDQCSCDGPDLFCDSEFTEFCSPACGADPQSCQPPG